MTNMKKAEISPPFPLLTSSFCVIYIDNIVPTLGLETWHVKKALLCLLRRNETLQRFSTVPSTTKTSFLICLLHLGNRLFQLSAALTHDIMTDHATKNLPEIEENNTGQKRSSRSKVQYVNMTEFSFQFFLSHTLFKNLGEKPSLFLLHLSFLIVV